MSRCSNLSALRRERGKEREGGGREGEREREREWRNVVVGRQIIGKYGGV